MKQFLSLLKAFLIRTIFCIGLITVICGSASVFYYWQNPDRLKAHYMNWFMEEEAVTSTVSLPREDGELTLTVVPLHPFLSEFKYIVRVYMKDGRKFKETLEIQSGGEPDVKVLYFEGGKRRQYMCFDYRSGSQRLFDVLEITEKGEKGLHRFDSLGEVKQNYRLAKDVRIRNLGWITASNLSLN